MMGRSQGTPGQRDRVYGRLGREHKTWVWKAENNDLTFNILESRSRLDVPSGRNLSKILSDKSIVQKSSAGSWPAVLPPSQAEKDIQRELDLVRISHQRIHGLPGNPADTEPKEPPISYPRIMDGGSNSNESTQERDSSLLQQSIGFDIGNESSIEATEQSLIANEQEGGTETRTKTEQKEIDEEKRFQQLIESISEAKKLTYSMTPTSRRKFNPNEISWDNRHHISVSSKNAVLHNLHRDFFDQPRGFDMCTKPRTALQVEPITEKLTKVINNKDEIRIFPKRSLISSQKSNRPKQKSLPGTRPASRPSVSPLRDEVHHSDSYLQPYALSRRPSGNKLYVPASLSL